MKQWPWTLQKKNASHNVSEGAVYGNVNMYAKGLVPSSISIIKNLFIPK